MVVTGCEGRGEASGLSGSGTQPCADQPCLVQATGPPTLQVASCSGPPASPPQNSSLSASSSCRVSTFLATPLVGSPSAPLWSALHNQGSPGPCGYLGNGSPVPTDGPVEDRLATTEDFQGLQAEVEAWAMGLEGLSREPCGQLLGALGQVLRDEAALQALDESVRELGGVWGACRGGGWVGGGVGRGGAGRAGACAPPPRSPAAPRPYPQLEHGLHGGLLEPRDGPVGAVLECLVSSSRRLEKRLAGPVFYLLQALAGEGLWGGDRQGAGMWASLAGLPEPPLTQGLSPVLSATQHVLLAEALEMGALSGAFKLVSGPSL